MLEIHRVNHHAKSEGDLTHSWVPFVGRKILRNPHRSDGHFTSQYSARKAIGKEIGQDPFSLQIRIVK